MNDAKTLLFFILFVGAHTVYAQPKRDTAIIYLNELLQPTTKRKALFTASGIKRSDAYLLIAYDADNRLMYEGTYTDKQFKKKEGPATYYYSNGARETAGAYRNNKKNGIWKSWYSNRALKDSGNYNDDLMIGPWVQWHPNGAVKVKSTIVQVERFTPAANGKLKKSWIAVADGLFNSWYDDGKPESEGSHLQGKQAGLWKYYYNNGNLSTEEWNNAAGKVDSMRCYDIEGRFQTNFCSLNKPALLKNAGDFRMYLRTQLKVPAGGITEWPNGDVTIRFTVNEKGALKDLKVISNHRVLAESVHDFMKKLPAWEPAISHNRIVEWKEEVTLDFGFNRAKNNKKFEDTQSPEFPLNAYEVEADWN